MSVPIIRSTYLSLLLILVLFGNNLYSQTKGTVLDNYSGQAIPFVKMTVTSDSTESIMFSDINGKFKLSDTTNIKSITFEVYRFRPKTIPIDSFKHVENNIYLNQYLLFEIDDCSSVESLDLINKVIKNKKENNFNNLKHFSYSTYTKTTFTPKQVEKTNRLLKKITDLFAIRFTDFHENQHFLLLESYTERNVYNKYHHKEIIKGAKSTILDVPSLFIQTTQFHTFTPYEDYINLSGKSYISPISSFIFHQYIYTIIDTIQTNSDTIYVVKYHPYPKENFEGLNGLIYVNTKNYAIQYFTASPFLSKKTQIETYQSFKYYENENVWFPDRTLTKVIAAKADETYTATLDSYISNVKLNNFFKKRDFDEIVLQYPFYANYQDKDFWFTRRKTSLTTKDSNTYNYYSTVDTKKYIQKTLTLGENLYYGVYIVDPFDIDLSKVFDANQLEGVRIGLGLHTNNKFSEQLKLGGYFGYGFRDQENKGGVDISYKLRNAPVTFQTALSHDIVEAGGVFFPFNTYQYSSERLRRLGIRMFDYVTKWENAALIHPLKFLDLKGSISLSHHVTSYAYMYRDRYNGIFNFAELEFGLRYAYGEQFIQLLDRKIPMATPFPVLYFHYTKGLNNFLGGDFGYARYEAKIDYKVKIPNMGTTGIELIGGLVSGNAPYAKLFNGNGSYRKFSVVIHNSFETMQYNEFLSDRYFALFMSHDFGKIYTKIKFIKPSLLIVQNFGYGSLKHPEYHDFISFKTMEKGYFESGMLLDNLLLLGVKSLKIGIGPGFFYRYGPYSEATFSENFVVKLSAKFKIQ